MLTVIETHKRQIAIGIIIFLLLPILVYIQNIIMTFGQCTGTAIRMYVEGICV